MAMIPSPMSVDAFNAAVDLRVLFIRRNKEFKDIIDGYFDEGLQQSEEFRAQLEARVTPEFGKVESEMKASLAKVDGAFTALAATVQAKVDAMDKAYADLEQRIGHSTETIDQMRTAGDEAFTKLQALQNVSTAEAAKQTNDVAARLQQV